MDAQLSGARAKQISADADVIAQVKQLPKLESRIADRIFFHVDLQPLPILLQVRKPSLPHQPDRHDAARHAHGHARRFQFLCSLPAILAQYLRNGMAEVVFPRICGLPKRLNLLELVAPDFIDVVVEWQ